jgi:uncharacterized membrane protein YqaE (UPF0057 family)
VTSGPISGGRRPFPDRSGADAQYVARQFFITDYGPPVVPDTLAAEINRRGIHSLEVPDVIETDGPFDVELRNHGEPTHVHLHLDDDLSRVASIDANNHYVKEQSTRPVRVHVDDLPDGEVRGKLKVVTAYGAETHYVNVLLDGTGHEEVTVDPDLSTPQSDPGPSALDAIDPETLPAVALGAVAVLLAVGAVVAPNGVNVIFGVLALVAGMLGAAYVLVQ